MSNKKDYNTTVKTSKRKKKIDTVPKIKLSKKKINQFGGEPCATGCTDGSIVNLAGQFLDMGVDTIKLIFDIGATAEWMIVDMPQELVGAIENPSVNTPLSNII